MIVKPSSALPPGFDEGEAPGHLLEREIAQRQLRAEAVGIAAAIVYVCILGALFLSHTGGCK